MCGWACQYLLLVKMGGRKSSTQWMPPSRNSTANGVAELRAGRRYHTVRQINSGGPHGQRQQRPEERNEEAEERQEVDRFMFLLETERLVIRPWQPDDR